MEFDLCTLYKPLISFNGRYSFPPVDNDFT